MLQQPRQTSWPMCNCCTIDIHIHYTFPLYILYRLGGGMLGGSEPDGWFFLFNLGSVCALFGTVLVHEFGHSFMAMKIGGEVEKILLWPFGGLAYCAFSREPWKQLAVSLAGPITHFPMAGLWYIFWLATRSPGCPEFSLFYSGPMQQCFLSNVALEGFKIQVFLCIFNLFFPVYPLDGGKIFITGLIMCCNVTANTAAKVCIGISTTLAGLLLTYSIYTKNWFSALLCVWILWQVYQMFTYLQSGRIAEHPLFEHAPGGFYNPMMERNGFNNNPTWGRDKDDDF